MAIGQISVNYSTSKSDQLTLATKIYSNYFSDKFISILHVLKSIHQFYKFESDVLYHLVNCIHLFS